jgi:hypothetical protein
MLVVFVGVEYARKGRLSMYVLNVTREPEPDHSIHNPARSFTLMIR